MTKLEWADKKTYDSSIMRHGSIINPQNYIYLG